MKLFFSSLLTLGLMGLMVLAIVVPTLGDWDAGLSIGFTFVLFALFWLVGPWINDIIYGWAYHVKWVDLAAFKRRSPAMGKMIERMAQKYSFKIPKIGIIQDNNPTAFTYGSGKWNPRLVVSEGIFVYLTESEREAVVAHEAGHIANNDFIIMTIAAFLVTVLYQLSRAFLRAKASGGSGKKGGGGLVIVGIIAYVFYIIGTYLLLFLSRTREYLADEFSAKETGKPDELSSALVKIAFGLLQAPDTAQSNSLAEATRTLGISDYKAAKSFGLAQAMDMQSGKSMAVEGAIRYDLHSIWAWWAELHSSHPLTGRRILRLEEQSASKRRFDALDIKKQRVDAARLRMEFLRDWFVSYLAIIAGVVGLLFGLFVLENIYLGAALLFFGLGLGSFVQSFYRYPGSAFPASTIGEAMQDLYASPVRGRPIALKGKVIGKGSPGYILSEDVMLQDKTGLLYLNFESIIPIFGNMFFSLTKVKELMGKPIRATGWFVRGLGQSLVLNEIQAGSETIQSRQRLMAIVVGFFWIGVGILALLSAS